MANEPNPKDFFTHAEAEDFQIKIRDLQHAADKAINWGHANLNKQAAREDVQKIQDCLNQLQAILK